MKNKCIVFGFIMMLLVFGVATIGLDDRKFSSMENRYLEQQPKLSMKGLLDGSYMEKLETYLNDQIFLKDMLVSVKADSDKMLHRKECNGVYFGEKGRYIQKYEPNPIEYQEHLEFIRDFVDAYKDTHKIAFFLAPNVQSIYPESLDSSIVMGDATADMQQAKSMFADITFVNPTETLLNHKKEYLYFNTDHHWTMRGAYYGYATLASAMGWDIQSLDEYADEVVSKSFLGTLYSKAPLTFAKKDYIEVFTNPTGKYKVTFENGKSMHTLFAKSNLYIKDKYTYFLDGNHPFITIQSNAKTEKKALVFKDSYSHALLPFVADQYSKIDVIDLRYYRDDIKQLIAEGDYDDILLLYNLDFVTSDDNFIELYSASK